MMRLAILPVLAALAACGKPVEIPDGPHAVAFEWRIVEPLEMREAYAAAGMPLGPQDRLDGFAGTLPDGRHVVYTLRPERLDDRATCTLGHEVLHVVAGAYH